MCDTAPDYLSTGQISNPRISNNGITDLGHTWNITNIVHDRDMAKLFIIIV